MSSKAHRKTFEHAEARDAKTARFTLRLGDPLVNQIQRVAEAEDESASVVMRRILRAGLRGLGYV